MFSAEFRLILSASNPMAVTFPIGAFHCGPSDAERTLLTVCLLFMSRKRIVEGFAKNALRMFRKMFANRWRKAGVSLVRHGNLPDTQVG
jgi:hypothetical protein